MTTRRRVGLLGGSFNPAHEGHRHISLLALQRLKLDEVWWLVSPQNPLKSANGMATFSRRVANARAVARHPKIRISTLEAQFGTRFTKDTLHILRARFPTYAFVWIIGADNLIQMSHWRQWQKIFQLTPIAVFDRPTYSLKALSGPVASRFRRERLPERRAGILAGLRPPAWTFIHGVHHPASATAIRQARQPRPLGPNRR